MDVNRSGEFNEPEKQTKPTHKTLVTVLALVKNRVVQRWWVSLFKTEHLIIRAWNLISLFGIWSILRTKVGIW